MDFNAITNTPNTSINHLRGILQLQQKNLAQNITPQEKEEQGFVTVVHTIEQLKKFVQHAPQFVAIHQREVVGYVLSMTSNYKKDIPVLVSMFETLEKIQYEEIILAKYRYIVCGQACVAKYYRGQGLLKRLYYCMRDEWKEQYDLCITEIEAGNVRSLKAHKNLGFKRIHTYTDDKNTWHIVVWDWRNT